MTAERRTRLLARIAASTTEPELKRVCEVGTEVTATTGAGIMLMPGDVPHGSLCTTDDVSALIEDLQFGLGEGPCIDAHCDDRPVMEPDLAGRDKTRWMAFTGPAVAAGVRAVFGFPLRIGEVRIGALNLYRAAPGPLTDEQHADALALADLAARAVLLAQAGAPPGQLAAELEEGSDFQYVVHQASGMVAAQLDVSVGQALIRLRAHAFASSRPLRDVAEDVVDRNLRFHDR